MPRPFADYAINNVTPALCVYARRNSADSLKEIGNRLETTLEDMLTDLMHVCAANALDFWTILGASQRRYCQEQNETLPIRLEASTMSAAGGDTAIPHVVS